MKVFFSRAEIGQAMATVFGDLLKGGTEQDVYTQSTTKNYNIGSKKQVYDRTFRYSYAFADLAALARLVVNSNYEGGVTGHLNADGYEGTAYAALRGQAYLDIKDTALRAADFYQGGKVIIYGSTIFHQYEIVSSDAGNGTYVRLYLLSPIVVEDVTASMGVTAYRSPYSAVAPAGSVQVGFETFIGVNLIPVTHGYYFWLQTAGPCIVTPTGGTWPGSAVNLRAVYPNPSDGTIQPATISDPSEGYQCIGFLLSATGGTANDYGDLWIQLRLDV